MTVRSHAAPPGCNDHAMTDITGIVNLVLFVCLVVYLTRLRATLTCSAEAQERIAQALERQVAEKDGAGAKLLDDAGADH
jgi:hypothetical protein